MQNISVKQEMDKEQMQAKLKELAAEISSDLSALEAEQSKELLSDFVSELFLAAAKHKQQQERRQKQAEGIAAAKARGVRFGRPPKPLPENFHSAYQRWKTGIIPCTKAAQECGMPPSTFRDQAKIYEKVRFS